MSWAARSSPFTKHLRSIAVAAAMCAALPWTGVARAQDGYREGTVANGGTIGGEASYAGAPPGPFAIWVKKNADVFGEKLPDERIIVSRAGKIKNVLITLEGVKEGKRWLAARPQLFNKGGLFAPHIQAVRTGAELEVTNQDPVLHNTHSYLGGRTLFNLAQPNQGQVIRKPLKRPGMVELMCDSHDWMNGWIAVLEHPYSTITGEDGTYAISDIPPGTYTLRAWHEKLGEKRVQVTVGAGKRQRADFTFSAK